MHPQLFLKTFWRMELLPQVFVAISFADEGKKRFDDVIAPAISSVPFTGGRLKPYTVDLSKSGDSILTDIMDGIAHSQLVLADVSTIGYDSKTTRPYRNGNVMYEVGLALACRHSSEVLLVRDDHHEFLFDVSTIPHKFIDFTNNESAIRTLRDELAERLREQSYINDARVKRAIESISNEEATILSRMAQLPPGGLYGHPKTASVDFLGSAAFPLLLGKQLIRLVGKFDDGAGAYGLTPFGNVVAASLKSAVCVGKAQPAKFEEDKPKKGEEKGGKGPG